MARDNLFTIPIFGRLLRCIAAYSVKRGQQDFKAIKESLKLLKEGSVIAIFPEGTRILGSRFGQAHLGVGMLAAHSGVPVVPVFIKGSEAALPKGTCLIRIRPIEAYIGKPIRFEECAPGEDKKQAYERFGQTLMKSIELLSKKDI